MILYYVRKESFGATVYQSNFANYFFITKEQLDDLIKSVNFDINMDCSAHGDEQFTRMLMLLREKKAEIIWRSSPEPLPTDTLAAPVRIYFEITRLCNGHCLYCLNNSGVSLDNAMSTSEMSKVIDNLGEDGILEVRLTGGETTVYPEYQLLAKRVLENHMALTINSNLLCSQKIISELIELNPNLLITSLDASLEAHEKSRGKGYQLVASNVKTLRSHQVPLRLNCMLDHDTLPSLEEFIDTFAPMGCGFCFIVPRPSGRASIENMVPTLDEFMVTDDLIARKQQEYPSNYFSTSFAVVMKERLNISGIELTGCNAIQKSFNINSDGSVLPCAFFEFDSERRFILGNVRNSNYSILNIWRNSELLKKLRQRSAAANIRCIHCEHFHKSCLGSCIFMDIYSEISGNPDPYCKKSLELHKNKRVIAHAEK
jgi:radical SAM protein with 4Fe4S-binding SPASM domain